MAVNLPPLGELLPVPGVRLASGYAGIKAATAGAEPAAGAAKDDLALIAFDPGTTVAGVYTQSRFAAAPVLLCREAAGADVAGFVINSGNANAATGAAGLADARQLQQAAATVLAAQDRQVLPFSTGVIGERLPVAPMTEQIQSCAERLSPSAWLDAATAIMTTDTEPKVISRQVQIAGRTITINGMAKGSGMIEPNMATMLSYVFCDAALPQHLLQPLCKTIADDSFNRVTIDGDTSTNDCFMLVATGASDLALTDAAAAEFHALREALTDVAVNLAQRIARDGEGATKFVTIQVEGGESTADCRQVAKTVANSPLVKTALFASDPNWGRICMAMGRAGVEFDPDAVDVYLNDLCIVRGGLVDPAYTEAAGARTMAAVEITLRLVIGSGTAHDLVWTSDLSHDYVRINSEYRT